MKKSLKTAKNSLKSNVINIPANANNKIITFLALFDCTIGTKTYTSYITIIVNPHREK